MAFKFATVQEDYIIDEVIKPIIPGLLGLLKDNDHVYYTVMIISLRVPKFNINRVKIWSKSDLNLVIVGLSQTGLSGYRVIDRFNWRRNNLDKRI